MALDQLLLAWLLVAAWLALWELAATRRAPEARMLGESALLTLLGALWFASLGTGAWWLVFLLIGAWGEWRMPREPRRTRRRLAREVGIGALGVLRVVVAGGLLAWRLAPA